MNKIKHDEIRGAVRDNYGKIALADTAGCGCSSSACFTAPNIADAVSLAGAMIIMSWPRT